MSEKSDKELIQIIENKESYQEDAIIAAVDELDSRDIASENILEIKSDFKKISQEKKEEEKEIKAENKKVFKNIGILLKPAKNYYITPILVYANFFIFFVMILFGVDPINPTTENLFHWGGNLRHVTLDGQAWRLLSCTFLHAGVYHITINSYALLIIGGLLEPRFGSRRFIFVYLIIGGFSSLASLYFNENLVSVGASGSIFGLYGIFMSLLLLDKLDISERLQTSLITSILLFVGYSLVTGFSQSGIDNAAHIGGLISGFLIGIIFCINYRDRKYSQRVAVGLVILLFLSVLILPKFVNNRVGEFFKSYDKFIENETTALLVFNEASEDISEDQVKDICERLEKEGIGLWEENIRLIENIHDLPPDILGLKSLLIQYSNLRIRSYISLQNFVLNNENADITELQNLSDSIDDKVNEIKRLYGN